MKDKISLAKKYAREAHKDDYYGEKPYFDYHILNVFTRAGILDSSPEVLITALLHDIHEDHNFSLDIIGRDFGEIVKEAVVAISYNKGNETREEYYERILKNDIAKIVKLADVSENLFNAQLENNQKRIKYYTELLEILYDKKN